MSIKEKVKFWKSGNKKKIKKRKKSWLYYALVVAFLIFLANFSMLLPQQWSAMFFEVEVGVLQFLKARFILHRWEFFLILLLSAMFGWNAFPFLVVPSLDEKGKSFFYYRKKTKGKTVYFKRIGKKNIAVNKDLLTSVPLGFRYYIKDNVERSQTNGLLALETDRLEVTKSEHDKEQLKVQAEKIANLREKIKKGGIEFNKTNVLDVLNRAKRGVEDAAED